MDECVGVVGCVAECGGAGLVAAVDGTELVSVVPDEWVPAVAVAARGENTVDAHEVPFGFVFRWVAARTCAPHTQM